MLDSLTYNERKLTDFKMTDFTVIFSGDGCIADISFFLKLTHHIESLSKLRIIHFHYDGISFMTVSSPPLSPTYIVKSQKYSPLLSLLLSFSLSKSLIAKKIPTNSPLFLSPP